MKRIVHTHAAHAVRLTSVAVAATLLASALHAQQRPDFSGIWTIATDAAAGGRGGGAPGGAAGGGGRGPAVGDMGSGWGSPLTIVQDANRLSVEYAFFVRSDMQPPIRYSYTLDGSESKNTVMMGRGIQELRSKAAWNENSLIVTTMNDFVNPANGQKQTAEMRQLLRLDSPTSLVIETTRLGVAGAPSNTTRTTYTKRTAPGH